MSDLCEPELPAGPSQSPLYYATNESRYTRQKDIREYERAVGRSLVVFWGQILPGIKPFFFEAVEDVDPCAPLDLMIISPGGSGEVALSMARGCQGSRTDFRVIVPDRAASAATLLALAADKIVMSDMSTLGPIDPQLYLPSSPEPIPAKWILEIDKKYTQEVQKGSLAPELYAALLSDIDAVTIKKAQHAVKRTKQLVPELMMLQNDPPDEEQMGKIHKGLQSPAIHAAAIGYIQAQDIGLPIQYLEPKSVEWGRLRRLYAKYFIRYGPSFTLYNVVEGRKISFEVQRKEAQQKEVQRKRGAPQGVPPT